MAANHHQKPGPQDSSRLGRLDTLDRVLAVAGKVLGLVLTIVFAVIAITHANATEWHVAAGAAVASCAALAAVTGGGKSG